MNSSKKKVAPVGEGQTVALKAAWKEGREWLEDVGFDPGETRYKVKCNLCQRRLDSKLDSIKSHEKGKNHEQLAKQAAVEERSKNRGLSWFGVDAVEQQKAKQVVILRAQFDKPVARQMAWLLSLLSRGEAVLAYSEIEALDRHLTTAMIPELQGCLQDAASRHLQGMPDIPDDIKLAFNSMVRDFQNVLEKEIQKTVPSKHWSIYSAWQLVESMGKIAMAKTAELLNAAPFISISLDEASAHGVSYMSVHSYYLDDLWNQVPVFLKLAQVTEAPNAHNLLKLLLATLEDVLDLKSEDLKDKVCILYLLIHKVLAQPVKLLCALSMSLCVEQ